MASAYAGLVSLLNLMDLVQIHPRLSTSFDECQNGSLREKVDFLVDFMENYSDTDSEEAEDLVSRISVAAHEAQDIIEGKAADRIRAGSAQQRPSFLPDLQNIIQEMDSIKENAIKLKEETRFNTQQPTTSMPPPSSSAPPATAKTTTMVGFDSYVEQLLDQLTRGHSGRQILPIVGMGGIGKTTLVRNVYDKLLTVHHFDVHAWVTVSQECSAREILLQALYCLGRSTSKMDTTDDQLGHELHQILYCRRYLIVLDDVWSIEAWEKIMAFFPENNDGSRIVMTTRQSELIGYMGSSAIVVDFLDDKNSWKLFCEKVFAQQDCPDPELEEVGEKIVKKCKGLPLAIVVIGGLLGESPRTQEYWEKIAKDKSLILDLGEGNKPWNILYLSYKHLPVSLKSCFLYLGLFPEDHQIDVSQLIKLWVAEGFIKSNPNESLEEVAKSYIKELIRRNLLLFPHLSFYKKLETCWVHDLVRDLCIMIAEKENFFFMQRDIDGTRQFIVDERTARFYHQESRTSETPSIIHPLILHGQIRAVQFKSRLLRVLFSVDGGHINSSFRQVNKRLFSVDWGHLDSTFREVNLRFLFYEFNRGIRPYQLPSSISLLWGLQTLIIFGVSTVVAPSEIWMMPQLRHIQMPSIRLPKPPPSGEQDDVFVLQNLQTLKNAHNLILSKDVCKRIPNIKDLQIGYFFDKGSVASWGYHLQNVGRLNNLESLQYSCYMYEYVDDSLQNLTLPSSLKELTLEGCHLARSGMAMVGSLPHLQILELRGKAIAGAEWICGEEQFLCLKHLYVRDCKDLIEWIADSSSFRVLETLSLWCLSRLDEIPSIIGEISSLERMHVYDCSESAAISAVEILMEQERNGNEGLQLQLEFSNKAEAKMLEEKNPRIGYHMQKY